MALQSIMSQVTAPECRKEQRAGRDRQRLWEPQLRRKAAKLPSSWSKLITVKEGLLQKWDNCIFCDLVCPFQC